MESIHRRISGRTAVLLGLLAIVAACALSTRWMATGGLGPESPGDEIDAAVIGRAAERIELATRLAQSGQSANALHELSQIPGNFGGLTIRARYLEASLRFQRAELSRVAPLLDELQDLAAPQNMIAPLRVDTSLALGQAWNVAGLLQDLIATQPAQRQRYLVYLANQYDVPPPSAAFIETLRSAEDPLAQLAFARMLESADRTDDAYGVLRSLAPGDDLLGAASSELRAAMGRILVGREDLSALETWEADLSEHDIEHPEVWRCRAEFALLDDRKGDAVAALQECLRRDANHQRACYLLGQSLVDTDLATRSRALLTRSGLLASLASRSAAILEGQGNDQLTCAQLCLELGRQREAVFWAELAVASDAVSGQDGDTLMRIASMSDSRTPSEIPVLADGINDLFEELPVAEFSGITVATRESDASGGDIRFRDDTRRAGLDFRYDNGHDADRVGRFMYEYTGGGVGVLDFDLDDFPDIYFTQGTAWPPAAESSARQDVLYRNRGGIKFESVQQQAFLKDGGFGQGVAAGDIDVDGMPDIYVANLNGNRLYRNNGDGTFDDVTLEAKLPGARQSGAYWTTSCCIADLTRDGLPEIYDVTFVEGDGVFETTCVDSYGKTRSCPPSRFEAALDRVYQNRGDGSFGEAASDLGFDAADGPGLGIVAGCFGESTVPSVFVANDGRPNFFFLPGSRGDWTNEAPFLGLAFNDSGASEAGMGVAAGDLNNDGQLDLFVTNYHHESNTLYVNSGDNLFFDRTRAYALHEPSWNELGFGTQFLDADLDGWEDLVVANGHVDDFRHRDAPFLMRAQCFRNVAGKRFEEVSESRLGEYFSQSRLGRGLATLDWNRDGRCDFVVSELEGPSSLVTNTTDSAAQSMSIKLIGTASRDLTGARIRLTTSGGTRWRHVVAGHGYQASNESRVIVGLGDDEPQSLTVFWPNGDEQTFEQPAPERRYLVRQGSRRLYTVPQ